MAAKKTGAKKKGSNKESKNYVEFKIKSESFDFSGRIYKTEVKNKGCVKHPVSLCINDAFTISGIWLCESDNALWLSTPQYKDKNDEYKNYIFIHKDFSEEFDSLAEILSEKLEEAFDDEEDD